MCNSFPNLKACPVAESARKHPDAIALIAEGKMLSYSDLDRAVNACWLELQSQDVKPEDSIVFDAVPSVDCCTLMWAIARLGAVACPLNPALPSANREEVIALLQPQWTYRRVSEAKRNPPPAVQAGIEKLGQSRLTSFAWDSPCFSIVMTSGSSGAPRAAAHSFDNHLQAALAANRNMPLAPGDRWLLSLPLFHVSGIAILFRCAFAGAAVVLPEKDASLETELTNAKATHASLVPTQLHRLLESETGRDALRRMKGVLLGGAPASPALIERAYDLEIPLVCSYGMTETAAQLCATPPGASLDTLLTSGYPLLPDTVRIGVDKGIEVCGTTLFQGYVTEANDCHLPLTEDGWFRTGDVGHFDAAGRLHVTGRADAMFISGGENIQPEEIEAALSTLPGIRRAVVVPVAHEEWGMVPAAFLDMESHNTIDAASLRTELAKRLPRFKIPRHYLTWPADLDAGMKADRNALAEKAKRLLA